MTTGGLDPLECLLRKIGIADSEFTTSAGDGRVHLYAGLDGTNTFNAGGNFTNATNLWNTVDTLERLRRRAAGLRGRRPADQQQDGGRTGRPWWTTPPSAAGCSCPTGTTCGWRRPRASWPTTATWNLNGRDLANPITATIDQTFPKGLALAQWLVNVGGSTTQGQISDPRGPAHRRHQQPAR